MLEGIDWHHQNVLAENVDLLRPTFHVFVVLLYPVSCVFHESQAVLVSDVLILQYFRNQFLKEEGGKDVTYLLHLWRQEHELH